MDQVQIYHPDLPATKEKPVTRPRSLYKDRMYDKGWRIWPPKENKEKE